MQDGWALGGGGGEASPGGSPPRSVSLGSRALPTGPPSPGSGPGPQPHTSLPHSAPQSSVLVKQRLQLLCPPGGLPGCGVSGDSWVSRKGRFRRPWLATFYGFSSQLLVGPLAGRNSLPSWRGGRRGGCFQPGQGLVMSVTFLPSQCGSGGRRGDTWTQPTVPVRAPGCATHQGVHSPALWEFRSPSTGGK